MPNGALSPWNSSWPLGRNARPVFFLLDSSEARGPRVVLVVDEARVFPTKAPAEVAPFFAHEK